jgi:hypothetical protein
MKKISLIIISIIFSTTIAWSEKVEVKNDQFTKAKVVTLDTWHKVKEGQLDNTRILYEKEIANGKPATPVAKFEFRIVVDPMHSYGGEDLDPIAYVLIDDASFKITLVDRKKTIQDQVGSNLMEVEGKFPSNIKTIHTAFLRCNIVFTPEMIAKIATAEKLKIRVSTNGNATVMEATKKQLKLVKEFFAAN